MDLTARSCLCLNRDMNPYTDPLEEARADLAYVLRNSPDATWTNPTTGITEPIAQVYRRRMAAALARSLADPDL
jgi:hypothetical protein